MRKKSSTTAADNCLYADWDAAHVWHPYTPLLPSSPSVYVERAKGVYLYTSDGRAILDGISSWWVNLHGHSHPRLLKALRRQSETLDQVIFAGFTHEPAIRLAKRLLNAYPRDYTRVFYSDNGSTAVEVALKLAIEYGRRRHQSKANKILALSGGYHGDTFGAMSVAERSLFTDPFKGFLFECAYVPSPAENEAVAMASFKKAIDAGDVAAFIFEPRVQAAGGMRFYSDAWLEEAIGYAQARAVPCIADEVFTGFGRTGDLFACASYTHQADLVALSKGITGGMLPLGATLCKEPVAEAFASAHLKDAFFHGHSYTANPMACQVGIESLSLLESKETRKACTRIANQHKAFVSHIQGHSQLANARSIGSLLALDLKNSHQGGYANPIRETAYAFFMARDILLRPLGQVLYVLPPYVIKDSELQRIYAAIEAFLDKGKAA